PGTFAQAGRFKSDTTTRRSGRADANQIARSHHHRRAIKKRPGLFQFQRSRRAVKIHSTAIIDPTAKIGADVAIGPYAVVGANVVIGERSTIESHAVIDAEVTMGAGNLIGHGAIIGTAPQDLSFSSERKTYLVIGNENVIREHCTIHRGSAEGSVTKIGAKNFFMVGAHF